MSLLIPTNLSGYQRVFQRPSEDGKDDKRDRPSGRINGGVQEMLSQLGDSEQLGSNWRPQTEWKSTTFKNPKGWGQRGRHQSLDPLMEPDEHGAELSREARFWKVYVTEADRWDAELVDGWNKSLDVILVFAALFSTVSTAFLVESSRTLKEDPNNVSATALVGISRTLVLLANKLPTNTSTLAALEQNSNLNFVPPQHSVVINSLWYLSLSLSLATSFLAMLAKDWCHSFTANRTGHPWDQAHRRQRKWVMIEHWRMQELIVVLPSIIHLSLLLFAVGLCIYIWDLNHIAAVPVVCVSGLAFTFYVWCSITAGVVEYFPYTTIVSRVLSSYTFRHTVHGVRNALSISTLQELLGGLLCFPCVILYLPCQGDTLRRENDLPMYLEVAQLGGDFLSWVFYPFELVGRQVFGSVPKIVLRVMRILGLDIEAAFMWIKARTRPLTQDDITGMAIGWLIQHCETPSSVSIALQAIAGANQRIPKEPLSQCQATLQILQQLVSSGPDSGTNSDTSLYARALTFLGSHSQPSTHSHEGERTGDIEVMIWDLKQQYESQLVDLTQNTTIEFIPTENNLLALKIGNAATSHSLRLMQGGTPDIVQTSSSIMKLYADHINSGYTQLHPASVQSLINTAILLQLCSKTPRSYPGLKSRTGPGAILAIYVLLFGHTASNSCTSSPHISMNARVSRTVRVLMNNYRWGAGYRDMMFWAGCAELSCNPDRYGLDSCGLDDELDWIKRWCFESAGDFARNLSLTQQAKRRAESSSDESFALLEAIDQVYELVALSDDNNSPKYLPHPIYVLVVRIGCMTLSDAQRALIHKWLSNSGLPELNDSFRRALSTTGGDRSLESNDERDMNRSLVALLAATFSSKRADSHARHFAATQLWLLSYLAGGFTTENQWWLFQELERDSNLGVYHKGWQQMITELEKYIVEGYARGQRLGTYTARIIECIVAVRGGEQSEDQVIRSMQNDLKDVPANLRGLSFPPIAVSNVETLPPTSPTSRSSSTRSETRPRTEAGPLITEEPQNVGRMDISVQPGDLC